MNDAMARSIAETAADTLGRISAWAGIPVPDEAIGQYLWHERGFREHDDLVTLLAYTRDIIDRRHQEAVERHRRPIVPRRHIPRHPPQEQLSFDLAAA